MNNYMNCTLSNMLLIFVQLLICLTVSYARPRQEEPICPKFYYEEKTLEKVVRLEHRLELQEQTVHALEEKLKDRHQLISEYETKLQSMVGKLRNEIHSVNTSVPTTVGFLAQGALKKDICDGESVRYKNVLMNMGNGFDVDTGYFTATISGVYLFNAQVCSSEGQHVHLFMVANKKTIASVTYHGQGDGACVSFGGVGILSEGQKAAVVGSYNCRDAFFENHHRWNTFSGILVNKIKTQQ